MNGENAALLELRHAAEVCIEARNNPEFVGERDWHLYHHAFDDLATPELVLGLLDVIENIYPDDPPDRWIKTMISSLEDQLGPMPSEKAYDIVTSIYYSLLGCVKKNDHQ